LKNQPYQVIFTTATKFLGTNTFIYVARSKDTT